MGHVPEDGSQSIEDLAAAELSKLGVEVNGGELDLLDELVGWYHASVGARQVALLLYIVLQERGDDVQFRLSEKGNKARLRTQLASGITTLHQDAKTYKALIGYGGYQPFVHVTVAKEICRFMRACEKAKVRRPDAMRIVQAIHSASMTPRSAKAVLIRMRGLLFEKPSVAFTSWKAIKAIGGQYERFVDAAQEVGESIFLGDDRADAADGDGVEEGSHRL